MHRSMETVREILEQIATGPDEIHSATIIEALATVPEASVIYHINLLLEAGLITGTYRPSMSSKYPAIMFVSLTWSGNELRDTLHNPEVWKRTKAGLTKAGGWSMDLAMGVAKAYAKEVVREKLGLHLE